MSAREPETDYMDLPLPFIILCMLVWFVMFMFPELIEQNLIRMQENVYLLAMNLIGKGWRSMNSKTYTLLFLKTWYLMKRSFLFSTQNALF